MMKTSILSRAPTMPERINKLSISILNCGDSITEERKHAILFAATILAARKLAEIGDKPCPAREACIEDAIRNASCKRLTSDGLPSEAGSSLSASSQGVGSGG